MQVQSGMYAKASFVCKYCIYLSDHSLQALTAPIGADLRLDVHNSNQRLTPSSCYKGFCHSRGYFVWGQHTHGNMCTVRHMKIERYRKLVQFFVSNTILIKSS